MKKLKTFLMGLYQWATFQTEDNKIKLTSEERIRLEEVFGEEKAEEIITHINQELAQAAADNSNEEEMAQLRAEAAELIETLGLSSDEAPEPNAGSEEEELTAQESISRFFAEQRTFNARVLENLNNPQDVPVMRIDRNSPVSHSATHLFASNHTWDSFQARPWNQLAAGNKNVAMPSLAHGTVEFETLNSDLADFYRKNPTVLRNYQRDLLGLPSFWQTEYHVDDRAADGNIVYGPITQARKLPWLPKGVASIYLEENRVFPTSIDIEIAGHELQKLMETWLNNFVAGTSGPYNISFVQFLISGWDKRARAEDRLSLINGIHVPTPDNATLPGMAIHTRDGLMKRLYDRTNEGRIKVAHFTTPTMENITDHVKGLVDSLPQEVKNQEGLVFYLSPSWLRAYAARQRELNGLYQDYKKDEEVTIDGYGNVRFQTLEDMEGTNFMFITTDDNIGLMENVPGEKGLYTLEKLKRNIYVLADYKLGVKLVHSGNKIKDTDPDAFRVQLVWHNGQPMFRADYFVHLYEVEGGELKLPFERVTFRDTYKGDITKISGTYPGQIIKIRGNANVTGAVKAAVGIASDFNLSTGGTLTLLVKADGTFKELSRTTEPEKVVAPGVNFADSTIDADEGAVFHFVGEAGTLTDILNGNEAQEIKIVGGAKALTINKSATINVDASVELTGNTQFLKLVKVDGVWYEIEKVTD